MVQYDRLNEFLTEYIKLLTKPVDFSNPRQVNDYLNELNPQRAQFIQNMTYVKGLMEQATAHVLTDIPLKSDEWTKIKNSSTLTTMYLRSKIPDEVTLYELYENAQRLTEQMSRETTTLMAYFKNHA